MKTEQPILITSITATEDLSSAKNLAIAYNGAICVDGDLALGILAADTNNGEQAPVIVQGIALVKSGGAISITNIVEADSEGRAILSSTGRPFGRALDAASGAGEYIRVLLIPSSIA